MRLVRAIAATLPLLGAWVPGAQAATAFFYSDPEQYYGWAAGYNYSRAESEAHKGCDQGGKSCKFVLECDGGWAAVAFADGYAKGVGFSCGYAKAIGARIAALVTCTAASRTLCWTSSTISNGGQERSAKDNRDFDMAFYAQAMLNSMGFDPGSIDGEMGGKTRDALKTFQAKLRLPPTGKLDDELFRRLLDAYGGRLVMAQSFQDGLVTPYKDEYAKSTFVLASQPYAGKSFSEEIATRDENYRRLTLATLLTMWDKPCTVPANAADAVPADGTGGWLVKCAEGDFTVLMSAGTHTIMNGLANISSDPGGTTTATPKSNDKTSPEPGAGTQKPAPDKPKLGTIPATPSPQADKGNAKPPADKNSLQ